MKKIFLSVIFALFFTFAAVNQVPAQEKSAVTPILFARYHINFAWSFTFKGITVDANGDVFSFDYGKVKLLPTAAIKPMNAEFLAEKYGIGKKHIGVVAADELKKMVALIPEAAAGSMSEEVSAARDKGSDTWIAYTPDGETGNFKELKLKLEGDFDQHNMSSAANTLVNWLNTLPPK